MCELLKVSRASYWRHWQASSPRQEETAVRDAVQRVALAHRRYGYRRVAAVLRREGLVVNHKRVRRLMSEDNLLCLRHRPFVPMTTRSEHAWPIVPNLMRGLRPSGPDQIWVADITYIRLREGFVYLAVVLDAFSRKVVGWAIDEHLRASLAVQALQQALAARHPPPGLIHHSDRGTQYASTEYRQALQAASFRPSMSRRADCYDNAPMESFFHTLKTELVHHRHYATRQEARRDIFAYIEGFYNRTRRHSAIGYLSPIEMELKVA